MHKKLCALLSLVGIYLLLSFHSHPETKTFSIPEAFLPQFEVHSLLNNEATQLLVGKKSSVLNVPANAFVDHNGHPITAPFQIYYKEYNNSADIAFSAIPMVYKNDNFNSSGMFEIQGKANGQSIQLAPNKSLSIDYQLAQKNPNTDFYQLDPVSNSWKFIAPIPQLSSQNNPNLNPQQPVKRAKNQSNAVNGNNNKGFFIGEEIEASNLKTDKGAGYQYPDMVRGLNIGNFGVYNCDQIYQVPNRIKISAKYIDEQGKALTNLQVLSLIDLDYNGAFSFHPSEFSCNAKGNNILALFDGDGELYLLDKGAFQKMNITQNSTQTFQVKKMSDKIRNSEELANYLGLN